MRLQRVLSGYKTDRKAVLANRDYLVNTGAAIREARRWPEAGVNMGIEDLLDYQRDRMTWLDKYYAEFLSGKEG